MSTKMTHELDPDHSVHIMFYSIYERLGEDLKAVDAL